MYSLAITPYALRKASPPSDFGTRLDVSREEEQTLALSHTCLHYLRYPENSYGGKSFPGLYTSAKTFRFPKAKQNDMQYDNANPEPL